MAARFMLLASALVAAQAIDVLRGNRQMDAARNDDNAVVNQIVTDVKPAADMCKQAKDDFLKKCSEVMKNSGTWCDTNWPKMQECLDKGTRDPTSCDKFIADANKAEDVLDTKGAAKAIVFWSGSADAAAKFAHANPNGKKGFVLDDTRAGKLLASFSMADFKAKDSPVSGTCNAKFGWPTGQTIVPWERASIALAASIKPGDDVYVILKRYRAMAVFGSVELPELAIHVTTPIHVRIHKSTVFNENGLKYKRACERVEADFKKFAPTYIPVGKSLSVVCHDDLGDDYAPAGTALSFNIPSSNK